ncbi:FAD-dependent oxidoreductase [Chitinophaga eiseniae]|uniref:FAD-dependent oxidoreductase n=1 Tax=Chitinophaga eiseniae TaxID=634771 RepID=A0A847SMQ8_9BACT|nr:FAD-dependent oxidoreductase [Chitinophaga eiseniae]NLR77242.1 FAD-dependent oxidoreductase [Chitinophaga eiseniae]
MIKSIRLWILAICCLLTMPAALQAGTPKEVDICVYGGTSAGIMAAYTAKKLHKSVLLIEPGKHLGGLTTGGLGYTDIGNKYAITGLARDFYRRIGQHYGKFEQWIFEPGVASQTFDGYLKSANVEVWREHPLTAVHKENGYIREITVQGTSPIVVKARVFIDCSYEGDLMAKAGVSYTVGREDNSVYQETYNGVQLRDKHQFPDGIDPYKTPGKPESGLLWGISPVSLLAKGTGDKSVQAYNFRICLTNQANNMIPITQPEGYDASRYELLLRVLEKAPAKGLGSFLKFDEMPNGKTDINNNGAFSTDMIGMNYNYPEADAATRQQIIREHEQYNKGLLYFIGHDPRMPEHLRREMLKWGYPKDEYTNNGHWSPQLYVREVRRMVGAYVMTQANCEGRATVNDGVGMAAYTMDSHNCQRLVVNGMVKNEGDVQVGGFGPYPVSYRALIPKAGECANLLVPVCLSASHIAYGSIRMEPVFMALAQSAATAAVVAIDSRVPVQDVPVKKVQQLLAANPLADNSTPEILVDNDDVAHVKLQGDWKKETRGGYGPSLYVDDSKGSTQKWVRFTPGIQRAGEYHIYSYVPKQASMATVTQVQVFDGKKLTPVKVAADAIKVEGQTSGEWVSLGTFRLPAGEKAYVEVSNVGADGVVVADALLFIAR